MFVVYAYSTPPSDKPFKVFSRREEAERYAESLISDVVEKATVYEVPGVDDVGKAIWAVKMEEGTVIAIKQKAPTPEETKKGWDAHVLKVLKDEGLL